MTDVQAKKIFELRMNGTGYHSIASELGLSRDAIRYFCKKNGLDGYASNLKMNIQKQDVCLNCGKEIEQLNIGRRRKFCSDDCRRRWWKLHPDALSKTEKATYSLTCVKCGKSFESYGNKNRKYCSHNCYIKDRFYEDKDSSLYLN